MHLDGCLQITELDRNHSRPSPCDRPPGPKERVWSRFWTEVERRIEAREVDTEALREGTHELWAVGAVNPEVMEESSIPGKARWGNP